MKDHIKFISFGAGVGSSSLLFVLQPEDYDLIIYADIESQVPEITRSWVNLVEKSFPSKFIKIKTKLKVSHPPICTKESKILPIRRYLRSIGIKKAIKILGYTYEEKRRRKENLYSNQSGWRRGIPKRPRRKKRIHKS